MPLLDRARGHGVCEQVVTGDDRLASVALGERLPQRNRAILVSRDVPHGLAVTRGQPLRAAGWGAQRQYQANARAPCPSDALIEPVEAGLQVLTGRCVVFELVRTKAEQDRI